ncbi:MAG: hypothetical protein ACK56I_30815, partial [bacterium]
MWLPQELRKGCVTPLLGQHRHPFALGCGDAPDQRELGTQVGEGTTLHLRGRLGFGATHRNGQARRPGETHLLSTARAPFPGRFMPGSGRA